MTKKDYDLIAEAIRNVGLWYHVGEGERQHGSGVVLFSLAMELGSGSWLRVGWRHEGGSAYQYGASVGGDF